MGRQITGRLVIATHNSGKLWEMRELLAPDGVDAVAAGDLNLPEPQETGTSFAENARIKAVSAARAAGLAAFADDSGLCGAEIARLARHILGAVGGRGARFRRRDAEGGEQTQSAPCRGPIPRRLYLGALRGMA